jgi:hypothetical protein
MRSALGWLFCLAVLLMGVALSDARAQYAVGSSGLSISPTTVTGVASTELDYVASLYYDPKVDGYLYRDGGLMGSDSHVNSGEWASAVVHSPFVLYTTFRMVADHWVRSYYWVDVESTIIYQDAYGFSLMSNPQPPYGGYYEYYPPYYYSQMYEQDDWLGTTAMEARVWPPVLTGINVLGSTTPGASGTIEIYGSDLAPGWAGTAGSRSMARG